METWDAIRARRNVRNYQDEPIPDADLDRILEAARIAPSGGNKQPWDFVVVTDRAQLEALAKAWPQGGTHIARAAAAVAVVAPKPKDERENAIIWFDLGQAAFSMMVVAADLGIGSGHSAVSDQDVAREVLGFPPDRFLAHMIGFGYPKDRPIKPIKKPTRRPFDEVVHRGRF